MKRLGNIWEEVCSIDNLRVAFKNAKCNRNGSNSVDKKQEIALVEAHLDEMLNQIRTSLLDGSYHTSKYTHFQIKERNKVRDIAKLPFYPDRIVHWAVIQVVEKRITNNLIAQTYASLPTRGTHKALQKTKEYVRKPNAKYCLKIDVKKFFESINKTKLMEILKTLIKDKYVLDLFYKIIFDYDSPGLPIGNYTSQYLANLYLSPLDHLMKEKYHCRYYLRYMDDIVLIGWSKRWLRRMLNVMSTQLNQMSLVIKNNWQIFCIWDRGIDFVGYRVYPTYTLLRTTTKKRLKKAVTRICKKLDSHKELDVHDIGCISAYKGILLYCNSTHLKKCTLHKIEVRCSI